MYSQPDEDNIDDLRDIDPDDLDPDDLMDEIEDQVNPD